MAARRGGRTETKETIVRSPGLNKSTKKQDYTDEAKPTQTHRQQYFRSSPCVQLEMSPNHDSLLAANVQVGAEEPAAELRLSIDRRPPR
eukprot:2016680-Heterocapsa_arctica.AAC.1